jgi:hypothetical protein
MSELPLGPPPASPQGQADHWEDQRRENMAQRIEVKSQAPLRSRLEQADVDGLALFDCARSPTLI